MQSSHTKHVQLCFFKKPNELLVACSPRVTLRLISDKDELRTKDASHVKEDSTRQAFYDWQEFVSLLKAEARRRWMDKPRWGCTATAGRPANHVCRMWNQETETATSDVNWYQTFLVCSHVIIIPDMYIYSTPPPPPQARVHSNLAGRE